MVIATWDTFLLVFFIYFFSSNVGFTHSDIQKREVWLMFMCTRTRWRRLILLDYSWSFMSTRAICNSARYSWGALCRIKELIATDINQIPNSVIPHGYGEMSGRRLWSSVINNTITEAIDYFLERWSSFRNKNRHGRLGKNKNELTSTSGVRASCSQ